MRWDVLCGSIYWGTGCELISASGCIQLSHPPVLPIATTTISLNNLVALASDALWSHLLFEVKL